MQLPQHLRKQPGDDTKVELICCLLTDPRQMTIREGFFLRIGVGSGRGDCY